MAVPVEAVGAFAAHQVGDFGSVGQQRLDLDPVAAAHVVDELVGRVV